MFLSWLADFQPLDNIKLVKSKSKKKSKLVGDSNQHHKSGVLDVTKHWKQKQSVLCSPT